MHPLRLVRIAIEAELLRVGLKTRRTAGRIVIGCIALVLLLGALLFGHVAGWYWLREYLAARFVALIFAGVDLLLALVLGLIATRSSPGLAEVEALGVRRRALENAAEAVTLSALLSRLVAQMVRSRPR